MGGVQTVTVRSEGPTGWMTSTHMGSTGPATAGAAFGALAATANTARQMMRRRRTLTSKS